MADEPMKARPAAVQRGMRISGNMHKVIPTIPQTIVRVLPQRATIRGASSAPGTDMSRAAAERMPIRAVETPKPSSR